MLWGTDMPDYLSTELERVQTRYAKSVLGVPLSTCDVFVRGELGMRSLASRRDEVTLRMFGELLSEHNSNRLVARVVQHLLSQARAQESSSR